MFLRIRRSFGVMRFSLRSLGVGLEGFLWFVVSRLKLRGSSFFRGFIGLVFFWLM